jgi:hypothetical protein
MKFVLLVCDDEVQTHPANEAEAQSRYEAFMACESEMKARGVFVGRERLRPTTVSTTVRKSDGQLVIADGPFAETKEQIAGYFVVDCADLEEAIEVAALIPTVEYGTIEVRPVWEM